MKTYDKIMKGMTPEEMAELGVKLVNVDNRRLFYMTSTGQLYPTNAYEAALQHEYNWLMEDDESTEQPLQDEDKEIRPTEKEETAE